MAKVKDPFGAREARGSVGGMTASRNTMGQYLRSKASPVQPRSTAQQTQRYLFQRMVRAFQNLTAARIQMWVDFAAAWPVTDGFGDSIHLTGQNWFVAFSTRLERASVSLNYEPPLNPNPSYTPTYTLYQNTTDDGDIKIGQINPTLSGDNRLWVFYTGNHPLSSRFAKKDMRLRTMLDSTVSNPHELIQYASLSPDDSVRQFEIFAVDSAGRATPVQRHNIFPVTYP